MFSYALSLVFVAVAAFAPVPQRSGQFPETPAEAAALRKQSEDAAAAAEKESTTRGLGAIDEARVHHALAATYADIENLLKQKSAYAAQVDALPARRAAAAAAIQKEQEAALAPLPPLAKPATDALLAELQASVERERAQLYEIELQLSEAERLAAGGAFAGRERIRMDAEEVDRERRSLVSGATAYGPRAAELMNIKIELRTALNRESLLWHDLREAGAESLILVLRSERDARKLELARRGREYDQALAEYKKSLETVERETRAAAAQLKSSPPKDTDPTARTIHAFNLKTLELRAGSAADRRKAVDVSVDRLLAGQLAEERARLQSLKSQFKEGAADGSDSGWVDTYHAIQELLKSKIIQDLGDELPVLKKTAARARSAAADARRSGKQIELSAVDERARANARFAAAVASGGMTAADRDTQQKQLEVAIADATSAAQTRTRDALFLADRAGSKSLTINRLLDTLAEEEQIVRSRGLFVRVGTQISTDCVRTAIADSVSTFRSTPELLQQLISNAADNLQNRDNLPAILVGAGILLAAVLLLFASRRLVARANAKLTAGGPLTLVDRAKRLGVGVARRMAGTVFFVVIAVVISRLLGSPSALVRAVDAGAIVILLVRLALAVAAALLRPDDARLRLLPIQDATAKYVWRVALLASMSVFVFSIPANVLDAMGYGEHNPGFMELLARARHGLVTLTVVLLFAKSSIMADLLPKNNNHTFVIARGVLLRLRTIALVFTIALFIATLAGFEFLGAYLESIAIGGAAILLLAAFARGATIELWGELAKRIQFGPAGADITKERREFLDRVVGTLVSVIYAFAAYTAFVVILRIGASELKVVDVGLVKGRHFNVSDIVYFALAIAATVVLSGWTRRGLELFALTGTKIDTGTRYAIAVTASYLVIVIGSLASLSVLGFQLGDFAIILGAAGFGVGLGMQETAANFICGLMLLFTRPVKVGDQIESEGRIGIIVDITITTTRLLTPENYEILIPNREIVGRRLVNHTGRDPKVRGAVRVGITASADPAVVREVMLRTARTHASVLPSPAPEAVVVEYGPNTLIYEIRFWTDVSKRVDVESDVRIALMPALGGAAIEIPLPAQEIRVRGPVQIGPSAA